MNSRFFLICCLIVMKVIYSPLLANDCGIDQQLQHKTQSHPIAHDYMPMPTQSPESRDNYQIKRKLDKAYEENTKEIVSLHNYVGFGVLIAIFYMNTDFRVRKKIPIIFTSIFSILSIFFNYLGCNYLVRKLLDLYKEIDQKPLASDYSKLFDKHECFLNAVQFFLVLAVIGLLFLGYHFLFDKKNQSRENKTR